MRATGSASLATARRIAAMIVNSRLQFEQCS
jgi:hypothetical protein